MIESTRFRSTRAPLHMRQLQACFHHSSQPAHVVHPNWTWCSKQLPSIVCNVLPTNAASSAAATQMLCGNSSSCSPKLSLRQNDRHMRCAACMPWCFRLCLPQGWQSTALHPRVNQDYSCRQPTEGASGGCTSKQWATQRSVLSCCGLHSRKGIWQLSSSLCIGPP